MLLLMVLLWLLSTSHLTLLALSPSQRWGGIKALAPHLLIFNLGYMLPMEHLSQEKLELDLK
jgi:hypothetical protein